MKQMVDPLPGIDVVPITHPVYVECSRIQGTAIAMQFTGNSMNYLIVAAAPDKTPPVWVSESEVNLAYMNG
jgi:hypothetical protein